MARDRILKIENGKKAPYHFSIKELDSRLTKLREFLSKEGIDSIIFTSIQNIAYFSDYVYTAFGRPYALVVDQKKSTLVTANIDYGQPYRRSYSDNIVYTDWQKDNFFYGINKLIINHKIVGLEHDNISLLSQMKITKSNADKKFVDIYESVMRMRMIKSEEEISIIKNGARVADLGGFVCSEAIKVGVSEVEISQISTQAMVGEIAKTYPNTELRDTWTWFQSGINTDGAHNPVTTRKIEKGDILSLNCFPMIAGYYTALERTLFCEDVSEEHLKIWEINCKVHKRGLELIKPGVKCCDIAHSLNEIYKEYDLLKYRTFGYGHSFGILSHYYGRETGLELREDIETVLQPNMVVSMEPMVTIPEGEKGSGGYREHDILVLTDRGSENITKFPFGPEHNIIKK